MTGTLLLLSDMMNAIDESSSVVAVAEQRFDPPREWGACMVSPSLYHDKALQLL